MLFYIFDDDERYKYLEEYLLKKKLIKTNNLENANIIIFPFIVDENKINLKDFFNKKLKKNVKLYVGVKSERLSEMCNEKNIELHEMMKDKSVIVQNSIATAEGVLKFVIQNNNKTIFDSSFLVMGYGFCGERIARNLRDLGGKVEVFDRNDFKMKKANLIGCTNINKVRNLNYDVVINTIPKKIIENNVLNNTAIIIDISSKPFGFDLKFAKENNIKINVLRKIPSMYATKSSGYILGDFIVNTLNME